MRLYFPILTLLLTSSSHSIPHIATHHLEQTTQTGRVDFGRSGKKSPGGQYRAGVAEIS